jgi:hypothetical protein
MTLPEGNLAMTLFPNAINATAYAIKLEIVLTNGEGAHGTGFLLLHKSQRWLVTCRHNIESAVDNLTGINEVGTIRSVLPAQSPSKDEPLFLRGSGAMSSMPWRSN